MSNATLVLNADFRPLNFFPLSTIGWQEAIVGVFQDKFAIVHEHDREVRSPSVTMRVPSVVALRQFVPVPRRPAFTRFNVFLRDGFSCQYCGETFEPRHLRFDHVIPRASGGETSWVNIVAACEGCNSRKGCRTDIKPRRAPSEPSIGQLVKEQRKHPPRYLHDDWLSYIYWDAELKP